MPRKTVIGINIATSASRSIGNLRWLLDRESVAAICGQASFIVKVERRGFYIHQEIAPGAPVTRLVATYPHQAIKGGYFVFVRRVGT